MQFKIDSLILKRHHVFESLVRLIDVKSWPKENMQNFKYQYTAQLQDHFKVLPEENGAETCAILAE